MPLVSVIVPNYNHAPYLKHRLESVLCQTADEIEVLILDDASTDGSLEVIRPFLSDSRVRFHPNTANSGSPFVQWNKGVALARGEFVWIAESDDFADSEFLSILLPLLTGDPKVGIAYCQSWAVDARDNVVGDAASWTADIEPDHWNKAYRATGRSECERYLLWKNTIPNASAVLFRRSVFLESGCAPAGMRIAGDWLTWVKMLLISDIAFTEKHLNYFRQHVSSVRSTIDESTMSLERWQVRGLIARRCRLDRISRTILAKMTADEFVRMVANAPRGQKFSASATGAMHTWPIMSLSPGVALLGALRVLRAARVMPSTYRR